MTRKFLDKVVAYCSQPGVNFYATRAGYVYTYHHPYVFQQRFCDVLEALWSGQNKSKPRRIWNVETGKEIETNVK